jgi:hypothetical protein
MSKTQINNGYDLTSFIYCYPDKWAGKLAFLLALHRAGLQIAYRYYSTGDALYHP